MSNYYKYKGLPNAVQAIKRSQDISDELRTEVERRISINADTKKCDEIKKLLLEGYIFKEQISKGRQCIFVLEKDGIIEEIKIEFTANINEIRRVLNILE